MEVSVAVATSVAESLVDGARRKVNYLCCFNTLVESFEYEKEQLAAIRSEVMKHIEDAKKRNEIQVADEVKFWLYESECIIQEDTKRRKKWFLGWCPDCIWQYRQGKKWAKKMHDIEYLIERSYDFQRVAHQAEIPGIKYHRGSDYIDFESRKSSFTELVEALESGKYNMIGLQGLGGTGKTTLAIQVGRRVEESKAFQTVIFATVSNTPDIKQIQADMARQLALSLEEREEAEYSKILCSRIANDSGRFLIILDDIWEELELRDIGIPHNRNNCCVLVTTRNANVCRAMRCQVTIHLRTLTDEEALNLFMTHANHDDLSTSDLKGVALGIVNECGGLPVAIVAIASTLRNWPVGEWKSALTTLQNSQPSVDVDEDLRKVYEFLKLSYENLGSETKKLFLLCSLFPEDDEIPITLLIRLGIGAGIFGEVDKYCEARRQALAVKTELIASSLLLEAQKERVKMHDLVRDVALWIADKDTQVIMNSKAPLKSNLRFLFWNGDDFPYQFHGTKLEVLILWIKGYLKLENAKAIFKEMGSLRVFVLRCEVENRLALPLQSFLLLKNIRTLILHGWELADISILEYMQSLETLELNDCSITELPKEIEELKKLKLLGLRGCSIGRNNSFEVIERCSQLEEFYFVENRNVEDWKTKSNRENIDKVSQDISPPALQMYSIACSGFEYFDDDEKGMLKCFSTKHVKNLISSALFQYLLERAEVLELWGKQETRWRSLVPDFIPIKDGVIHDLTRLCLYEWDGIEYLIDARELDYPHVTVFSKLVELHMRDVEMKELCLGPMPSGFLENLQVLRLSSCMKLHNIFLDGYLKLPHLKVLKLENCPMFQSSIFKPSVARSLARLEELVIEDCNELTSVIAYGSSKEETVGADHQNSSDGLFPCLKALKINGCEKLEMVSPLLLAGDLPLLRDLSIRYCAELRYIFDEYRHEGQFLQQLTLLPSLTKIDLYWVPSLINTFRKCKEHANFKTRATDTNIAVSKAKMQQNRISLESLASRKGIEIVFTAECFLRPPMGFQNLRHMKLWEFPNLRSLFSVRIAASITLEKLEISYCEELKHIITTEGEDYDHISCSPIFPKLEMLDIYNCNKLEYVFPSTFSGGLQNLKCLTINGAFNLKYVFGRYNHQDHSSNDEFHIDLPALEALSLEDVPSMIGICIKLPPLKNLDAAKATIMQTQNVTSKGAKKSEIEEIINVERPVTTYFGSKYGINFRNLQEITITRSPRLKTMFSTSTWRSLPQLSQLRLWECDGLRCVVEDDSKDHHGHISYSSIFPRLEDLEIGRCMNLEFIFPSPVSGGFPRLKHLVVREAPKLRCIFVTNENESDEVQVDLSALETLSLIQVPSMINICAEKNNILILPSLRNIALDNCQELSAKSFPNLTFYWKPAAAKDLMRVIMHQQELTSLTVEESTIEEVLNFEEYVEVEGPVALNLELMTLKYLRELRYICRGPKNILGLQNLSKLEIKSCPRLRVVFDVSMSKSLPKLSDLRIKDCPELVQLIEEDYEERLHQRDCFPKLEYIDIGHCHRLRCLFSISKFGMLPMLQRLEITYAPSLEQVFTDDMQKMVSVKDVFPSLSSLILKGLPCLVNVCGSINFRTVQNVEVVACPNYRETTPQLQNGDSEIEEVTQKLAPTHFTETHEMPRISLPSSSTIFAESSKEAMATSVKEVPISTISSVETLMEIQAESSTPASSEKQAKKAIPVASQLTLPSIHELEDEQPMSEPPVNLRHQDRGEAKTIIAVPQKTNTPFHDDSIRLMLNERVQEGATMDDVMVSTLLADSATKNSTVCSMKETAEQGFQEHDGSKEAIIAWKQSGEPLDTSPGNEFAPVTSMEEILERGLLERVSPKYAIYTIQEAKLESAEGSNDDEEEFDDDDDDIDDDASDDVNDYITRKIIGKRRYVRAIFGGGEDEMDDDDDNEDEDGDKSILVGKHFPHGADNRHFETVKGSRGESVQERPMSAKFKIVDLSDNVISSLHHHSQIGSASTSSSTFEIAEILELVKLKDDERDLLEEALKQYPKLRLSRSSRPIIAFAYRVLTDILVMLKTKTHYTMTEADKSTLEANLGAATYFGFDKDWVESVRTRVSDVDMSDVLATKERFLIMEAKLEEHDSALEHMKKEKAEAKERLETARKQLEKAQREFETIDSQLLSLMVDCQKLITNMTEPREVSARDGPFGI